MTSMIDPGPGDGGLLKQTTSSTYSICTTNVEIVLDRLCIYSTRFVLPTVATNPPYLL